MLGPRHESHEHLATSGDMDGMDMSGTGSSSMHMMGVFQNSIATALFSEAWTPNSAGTYAGTIIFLIVLSVIFRLLLAGKGFAEQRWLDAEMKRRYVVVQGKLPVAEQVSTDSLAKKMTLTENGVEEDVVVVQKRKTHPRPWRLSVDPLRAALDTCITGVSYLSMLAVMTMNVGYFLAVLGGTFLGSLLVGRFYSVEH
ncbi:Ctr copper transporter [Durotheca rogersii]|uniref:Ctr copper transporter n=1 Tax=Durotheca rogersii TaxID=419775 RepID=UPI0022207F4E|nr:Ctr copper transporter [Durotheca rogersii]KAI5867787.1 Ctr copper transporter [Durotheca rogersii]